MKIYRFFICAFLAIPVFFALCACDRDKIPQGTVASVNGELISLHSVQALLDSRSSALGIPSSPSVSDMRKRYGNALSVLIIHTLVRQALAQRGLAVSEDELDKAIEEIKSDYTGGSLEDFLAAAYLREDEWRQLMLDYLSLQAFTNRVLLPSIDISLDELQDYYKKHSKDFTMPETWRVCFKSGSTRLETLAWCNHLYEGMPTEAGVQCVTLVEKEMPQPWQGELKKIKPLNCGKIVQEGAEWRSAAVMERFPAGKRKLSDIYALVENNLLNEKKNAAFEKWLEQELATADIKAAPDIFSNNNNPEDKES